MGRTPQPSTPSSPLWPKTWTGPAAAGAPCFPLSSLTDSWTPPSLSLTRRTHGAGTLPSHFLAPWSNRSPPGKPTPAIPAIYLPFQRIESYKALGTFPRTPFPYSSAISKPQTSSLRSLDLAESRTPFPVATRASRSLSARPKVLGEFAGCSSFFPCPRLGFWCTESREHRRRRAQRRRKWCTTALENRSPPCAMSTIRLKICGRDQKITLRCANC